MKKLLTLLLVFTFIFSLSGCAFSRPTADPGTIAVEEQTEIATVEATQSVTEQSTQPPTQAQTQSDKISEKKAKEIALQHAQLSESQVTALFVELDYDDGVLRYEVDFRSGGYEYDYDIDAATGTIMSYDKDFDD